MPNTIFSYIKNTKRKSLKLFTLIFLSSFSIIYFTPVLFVSTAMEISYLFYGLHTAQIRVDDVIWPYIETGDKNNTPIIMLHGFGSKREAMMNIMPWVSETHHVIAPDLPGFGSHSFHTGQTHDADFYARELLHFINILGLQKVDLLGTSMGGALAAYFAAQYPDRVDRLILLSPAGIKPPVKNYLMRSIERGKNPLIIRDEADFDRVIDMAFDQNPSVPWQFRRVITQNAIANYDHILQISNALQPLLMNGLSDLLPKITARTLIIWGDRDDVIDPSALPIFVHAIPNAKGVLIDKGGHIISDDCPDETKKAIVTFLKESSSK